ncbi:MAG: MotA/TolQ/ExbB proton channel family protein [Elusimicrobia bacterium]|nr:MotA/TolQ/ExbB proton channel family protein [Elusimicrobiota bacterium]
MDIATIAGIIVFLGFVFASIFLAEGISGFKPFVNLEAFMVVIGGTLCALLVNYPLRQVFGVFKVLRKVLFTSGGEDTTEIVSSFVDFTKKARTEGLLSLEGDVKNVKNDFMRRGVQLVIDGFDSEFIRNMLETEIGFIRERHKVGQEIFNSLGTYSPAFGIIGTVLGMILLLSKTKDVAGVPARMAMALAAAFYGLSAGYLLFYPMAGKLRRRSEEELLVKEIIIRGVLLLQSGVSPIIMESNLKAYLEPAQRLAIKSTGK